MRNKVAIVKYAVQIVWQRHMVRPKNHNHKK